MGRDEMSNHYRGPSIDASYQVSVHLAEGFQRRRLKCEKLTDDGLQVDGKSSHCLWQGELKIQWCQYSSPPLIMSLPLKATPSYQARFKLH